MTSYQRLIISFLFVFIIGFLLGSLDFTTAQSTNHLSGNHVYDNNVVVIADQAHITLPNKQVRWTTFDDTHSMEPLFGSDHNGLLFTPTTEDDISVGDIITFTYNNNYYIHRVITINEDTNGWYALTKGDNNINNDNIKIRFNDITGVLFGLLF